MWGIQIEIEEKAALPSCYKNINGTGLAAYMILAWIHKWYWPGCIYDIGLDTQMVLAWMHI
jgi:hypothetical protein